MKLFALLPIFGYLALCYRRGWRPGGAAFGESLLPQPATQHVPTLPHMIEPALAARPC